MRAIDKKFNERGKVLGGKWKPMIMFIIFPKPERFNKIKQLAVGISANQLARSLKELERDKVIERIDQLYALTPVGHKITQLMIEIKKLVDSLD